VRPQTVRQDFEALAGSCQPDEIDTVTSCDDHPDHHGVVLFAEDALASFRGAGAIPSVEAHGGRERVHSHDGAPDLLLFPAVERFPGR
jgi:hypothetical protein